MKLVLHSAAVAACVSCATHAAQAQTVTTTDTWRGGVMVTEVTAACAQPGFPTKNQTLAVVFRPKLEDGDPPCSILVTFANGAMLASPVGTATPPPNNGRYTAVVLGGLATNANVGGTDATYSINFSQFMPAAAQFNIVGTMNKFRGVAGCTVKFKGGLVKGVP